MVEHMEVDVTPESKADVVLSRDGQWPLSDAYFDAVICTQVLEDVSNMS